MANVNCEACNDIRTTDPTLAANGWTDTECTSFQNDTGLNPKSGHNDCTDLENLNDCLIGNLDAEVDKYEVCDWKEFMHDFIPNLWTVLTAIKCAICGLWTNIHNLWEEVRKLWVAVSSYKLTKEGDQIILTAWDGNHGTVKDDDTKYALTGNGMTVILVGNDGSETKYTIPTYNSTKIDCILDFLSGGTNASSVLDESDFVAGTGVDFDRSGSNIAKPTLRINGSTYTLTGSINIDTSTQHWGRLGLTNTGARVKWGTDDNDYNRINTPNGNYTICYIKIKKSKLPYLKSLSSCVGTFVNASVGQIFVTAYDGDTTSNSMTGQWGYESASVTVPPGYIYLRVSLVSLTTWGINYGNDTSAVTFRATGLAQTTAKGISCN